jgi:hypothetical protein
MESIVSVLVIAFSENITSIAHNSIFSFEGASFNCQTARGRRPSLPRDAQDFRVLVEFPPENDQPGWELEVLVAVRDGAIWNPKAHLAVKRGWAEDTDDQTIILARAIDWAMSL